MHINIATNNKKLSMRLTKIVVAVALLTPNAHALQV